METNLPVYIWNIQEETLYVPLAAIEELCAMFCKHKLPIGQANRKQSLD